MIAGFVFINVWEWSGVVLCLLSSPPLLSGSFFNAISCFEARIVAGFYVSTMGKGRNLWRMLNSHPQNVILQKGRLPENICRYERDNRTDIYWGQAFQGCYGKYWMCRPFFVLCQLSQYQDIASFFLLH